MIKPNAFVGGLFHAAAKMMQAGAYVLATLPVAFSCTQVLECRRSRLLTSFMNCVPQLDKAFEVKKVGLDLRASTNNLGVLQQGSHIVVPCTTEQATQTHKPEVVH